MHTDGPTDIQVYKSRLKIDIIDEELFFFLGFKPHEHWILVVFENELQHEVIHDYDFW